jgi:hypothetical protein
MALGRGTPLDRGVSGRAALEVAVGEVAREAPRENPLFACIASAARRFSHLEEATSGKNWSDVTVFAGEIALIWLLRLSWS